jgi:hypothetical protein
MTDIGNIKFHSTTAKQINQRLLSEPTFSTSRNVAFLVPKAFQGYLVYDAQN